MKQDQTQQQNLDQEIHDKNMKVRDLSQLAKNLNALMDSKDKDSLHEKRNDSSSFESLDAIERALLRFPKLTREKAEAMARAYGF